jgi:hypothetical protein
MVNKYALLLLFLIIAFSAFIKPLKATENSEFELFSPETDEVLHMQTIKLTGINSSIEHDYNIRLMNTNPPSWAPFYTGVLGKAFFATPPLASDYTFSNLTLTICHAVESSAYMEVGVGKWDTHGNADFEYNTTAPLTSNYPWTNATINATVSVEQGERLLIWLRTTTDGTANIMFYFGDSDHDSKVRYAGTANYVPEMPLSFIFLLFVSVSSAAILLKKRGSYDKQYRFSFTAISLSKPRLEGHVVTE